MEETKVTNGYAGFHSANAMQEIRGDLKRLTTEEGANKNIVTNLTEAVEKLTTKNASLIMQLSNAMKITLTWLRNLISRTHIHKILNQETGGESKEKGIF